MYGRSLHRAFCRRINAARDLDHLIGLLDTTPLVLTTMVVLFRLIWTIATRDCEHRNLTRTPE